MTTRPVNLNLGCGTDIRKGWVNLDMVALPGVDVVHDLDVFPWPFEDETFEHVEAYDVFEHVDKPLEFVRELHRICKTGATVVIHTTHWQSPNAWTDPTHKRSATENTFDYWVPGTYLYERYGAAYAQGCVFSKEHARMDGTELEFVLHRLDKE